MIIILQKKYNGSKIFNYYKYSIIFLNFVLIYVSLWLIMNFNDALFHTSHLLFWTKLSNFAKAPENWVISYANAPPLVRAACYARIPALPRQRTSTSRAHERVLIIYAIERIRRVCWLCAAFVSHLSCARSLYMCVEKERRDTLLRVCECVCSSFFPHTHTTHTYRYHRPISHFYTLLGPFCMQRVIIAT